MAWHSRYTYAGDDPEEPRNHTRAGWLAAAKALAAKGNRDGARQARECARLVGVNNTALTARRRVRKALEESRRGGQRAI